MRDVHPRAWLPRLCQALKREPVEAQKTDQPQGGESRSQPIHLECVKRFTRPLRVLSTALGTGLVLLGGRQLPRPTQCER